MKSIDLSSVDLNLLVTFEALYEEQSVTAAAQRLHLGQPAMSAALGRLRLLLKDELFIRTGRQMKPTAKAMEIAPQVLEALRQVRQILTPSAPFEPAQSEHLFCIGSTDYVTAWIAPKLLHLTQPSAPGISWQWISFDKEQVVPMLEQQIIDVALSTFTTLPPQIKHCSLGEERFVGICRKGHPATEEDLSPAQYAALPHALFTLRRDTTGEIDRALARQGLRRPIVFTTSYFLVLPEVIASTDLVAAVPSHLARYFAEQGKVDVFELPIPTEPWLISMIWSKLMDQDPGHQWLRHQIQTCYQHLRDPKAQRH